MYRPESHIKDDFPFIENFIKRYPFATIVIKGSELIATHIPLLIDSTQENFRLFGHIANHNTLKEYLENETEILCIFQGPHTYISSSLYSEPDISTWNYSAVHINAKIEIQNSQELEKSLEILIHTFEKHQEKSVIQKEHTPICMAEKLSQNNRFLVNSGKNSGNSQMAWKLQLQRTQTYCVTIK